MPEPPRRVLCTHNVARSILAEGSRAAFQDYATQIAVRIGAFIEAPDGGAR